MVTDVEKNDDEDVIGDGLYESFERNNQKEERRKRTAQTR